MYAYRDRFVCVSNNNSDNIFSKLFDQYNANLTSQVEVVRDQSKDTKRMPAVTLLILARGKRRLDK